jgi:hypothetical protein
MFEEDEEKKPKNKETKSVLKGNSNAKPTVVVPLPLSLCPPYSWFIYME